jgi:segregation and condensation protein B
VRQAARPGNGGATRPPERDPVADASTARTPGSADAPDATAAEAPDADHPTGSQPAAAGVDGTGGPRSPADDDRDRVAAGPSARATGEGDVAGPDAVWPSDELLEAVDLDSRGAVRRDLEAILLVADEPVASPTLAEAVGARISEVEAILVELAGDYARDSRGFVLQTVAGGWRLATHPGARNAVEGFLRAGQSTRLTRAALETLAVVVYRQPVTRFQVAAVRGVNVDGVFRTLLARGLIREVGQHDGPGQAVLYGTTPAFLEQLGLNGLDELPPIKDYLPEEIDLADLQDSP